MQSECEEILRSETRKFPEITSYTCWIKFYYMASSVSGQDEVNHELQLATRAGNRALLGRSGLLAVS